MDRNSLKLTNYSNWVHIICILKLCLILPQHCHYSYLCYYKKPAKFTCEIDCDWTAHYTWLCSFHLPFHSLRLMLTTLDGFCHNRRSWLKMIHFKRSLVKCLDLSYAQFRPVLPLEGSIILTGQSQKIPSIGHPSLPVCSGGWWSNSWVGCGNGRGSSSRKYRIGFWDAH